MKKNIYIKFVLLLLAFNTAAFAQDKVTTGAKNITDAQKGQLKLDDAQYKKVYDINIAFLTDLQAVKSSGEGRMAKAKTLKAIDKTRDEKMEAILTPVQYKTFLSKKKENRTKMKEWYQENKKN
ncbi:hypothetical protein ACLI09_06785 [Flavobacterium sp. RHBU_24]|uniref:hypothetical protein n=1 Tax=Flavobacterium sp. RHBU_24 TaxID=3391185 RepID=UPI003984EDAF